MDLVGAFGLITEGVRFGGLLTSVLSCTLLAELAVGLIIRARKLSSGPLGALAGLLSVFLGTLAVDASDDRAAGFVVAAGARVWGRLATAGLETDTEALDGCESCLAAEAAVGAVRCEDTLIGRVGDRGRVGLDWGDFLVDALANLAQMNTACVASRLGRSSVSLRLSLGK